MAALRTHHQRRALVPGFHWCGRRLTHPRRWPINASTARSTAAGPRVSFTSTSVQPHSHRRVVAYPRQQSRRQSSRLVGTSWPLVKSLATVIPAQPKLHIANHRHQCRHHNEKDPARVGCAGSLVASRDDTEEERRPQERLNRRPANQKRFVPVDAPQDCPLVYRGTRCPRSVLVTPR
jgi:hypothetical protein